MADVDGIGLLPLSGLAPMGGDGTEALPTAAEL
jgi:hypothetical protein